MKWYEEVSKKREKVTPEWKDTGAYRGTIELNMHKLMRVPAKALYEGKLG